MTLRIGAAGPDVCALQRQLAQVGLRVPQTGFFGELTDATVRMYQREAGLSPDGVGPITLAALAADCAPRPPELATFRGRLGFLLGQEGHAGRPYWPGAASGVTLDPGFDLRYQTAARLEALYGEILHPEDLQALELAIGVGPRLARELVHDPMISRVRISRLQSAEVLPQVAGSYWRSIVLASAAVVEPETPAGVHSALLSLTYNLGLDDLMPLLPAVAAGDWPGLAGRIAVIPKLPERRRAEAARIA